MYKKHNILITTTLAATLFISQIINTGIKKTFLTCFKKLAKAQPSTVTNITSDSCLLVKQKNCQQVKIIKFGGSIITDKGATTGLAQIKIIKQIAKEIADYKELVIVTHGTGSFGHPLYKKYNLAEKFNLKGAIKTYRAEKKLNKLFIEILKNAGANVLPINPLFNIACKDDRIAYIRVKSIKKALDNGYIPVLFGTMVPDFKKIGSGLSSDQITTYLAKELGATEIGFGSSEDGVYDEEKVVIEEINGKSFDEIEKYVGGSVHTDCTGGMLGKVKETLLLEDTNSYIFNAGEPGNVTKFLEGNHVGTKITQKLSNSEQEIEKSNFFIQREFDNSIF